MKTNLNLNKGYIEDLIKCKAIPYSWIGKLSKVNISIISILIWDTNENIKQEFVLGFDEMILNFIWKNYQTQIAS